MSLQGVLCFVLGAILLVAAGLKAHQLLTTFVPGKTFLTSRTVQLLTVESELALGLLLVSGFYRRWAAWLAFGYFVALAGVSAYLLTTGVDCCGCLGRLAISPWFTFFFNVAAIAALATCPADVRAPTLFGARPGLAIGLFGAFVFLGLYLAVACSEKTVASSEDLGDDGALVILDVENWKGKPLPILRQIDIAEKLSEGEWIVVLIHHDCAKCREAISALDAGGGKQRIALIEVPSFDVVAASAERSQKYTVGRLSGSRRWVVETPQILRMNNRIVTESGLDARAVLERGLDSKE